jgi:hypothetical protein
MPRAAVKEYRAASTRTHFVHRPLAVFCSQYSHIEIVDISWQVMMMPSFLYRATEFMRLSDNTKTRIRAVA